MTFSDYLLDSTLILLVFRQLRESRLDRRATLLPLIIVAVVARSYLHSIPTGGNNLALVAGLTLVGVTLGAASGLATRVRADGGQHALVKAGALSAGLWVLGMGSRMAFAIWASHSGGPSLLRFSTEHRLNVQVWTAALVLMALGEVVTRVGVLQLRSRRALEDYRPATPALRLDKSVA